MVSFIKESALTLDSYTRELATMIHGKQKEYNRIKGAYSLRFIHGQSCRWYFDSQILQSAKRDIKHRWLANLSNMRY